MATLTEGARNAQFIVSEANGHRSRESGVVTVPANTTLEAGTVLGQQATGGKFVRHDSDGADDGRRAAAGILFVNVRNDTDGAKDFPATVFVRDAEVTGADLIYEDGANPTQINAANAGLAALGIVVR